MTPIIPDKEKLLWQIEKLAQIGKDEHGGTTRLLYSTHWLEAQEQLARWMQDIGLSVRTDAVGNLFGRLEGTASISTIMIGSHIDTVIHGGAFDGALGIIAALEAIRLLKLNYGNGKHSLEIAAICDEEGTRFRSSFVGSRAIIGRIKLEEIIQLADDNNIAYIEAMKKAGLSLLTAGDLNSSKRRDISAYIEFHVEQGNILDDAQIPVGIVTAITGQVHLNVTIKGQESHAGTTTMDRRKDALVCAASMITKINQAAVQKGNPTVATVGKMTVQPNVSNVIPGKVMFTVDIRYPVKDEIRSLAAQIVDICNKTAGECGVEVEVMRLIEEYPVDMDQSIINIIETGAKDLKIAYLKMASGTGHDAQIFAGIAKTGMIFVPSVGGISHNQKELTRIKDIEQGVRLLTKVLHELAY